MKAGVRHECRYCGKVARTNRFMPATWCSVATGSRTMKFCSVTCAQRAWPEVEALIEDALREGGVTR
jgi:hypothetical protein